MSIELLPFDPLRASEKEWARFHEYRRKRYAEHSPGEAIIDDSTIERTWRDYSDTYEIHAFVVLEAGKTEKQIGLVNFAYFRTDNPSYETNKHTSLILNFELLDAFRRKGIGRKLLGKVAELAKEHNKSLIIGWTTEADGKAFIRAIEAEEGLIEIDLRLSIDRLDWDLVEQWVRQGSERSPYSELTIYQTIPDDIIEPFCQLFTEIRNQEPRGGLHYEDEVHTPGERRKWEAYFADIGATLLTAIIKEPNDDLSGFTGMIYLPSKKTRIDQVTTGVREQYRGTGKAKWLIAAMLLKIREDFSQVAVVRTETANINAPMIAINNQLGFKSYKETLYAQITLKALEKYLEKS
ncbi:MAG: GNAT family N-acetyltransferase [Candidatus Hodarchaeota archaeon]